jgi:hypothetical protein
MGRGVFELRKLRGLVATNLYKKVLVEVWDEGDRARAATPGLRDSRPIRQVLAIWVEAQAA